MHPVRLVLSHLPVIGSFLVLLFAPLLPSGFAQAADLAAYPEQIARARTLAAEKSWTLARDAFASALPLAPNVDARRWNELWLEDATWRAEDLNDWRLRSANAPARNERFTAWEKPYREGLSRDDWWLALRLSWADFKARESGAAFIPDYEEPAAYLASQLPTRENAVRLVGFLHNSLGKLAPERTHGVGPYLEMGVKADVPADDRAWCAWQIAHLGQFERNVAAEHLPAKLHERAARWALAHQRAAGTGWAPVIAAEDFIWRTKLGWREDDDGKTPPDIAALLTQGEDLRDRLQASPQVARVAPLARELDELIEKLAAPVFTVWIVPHHSPRTEIRFQVASAGAAHVAYTLLRVVPEVMAGQDFARELTRFRSQCVEVKRWSRDYADVARRAWHAERDSLGQDLPAGFYVLEIEASGGVLKAPRRETKSFLISSLQGVVVATAEGSGELIVQDGAGRPVAGAPVAGFLSGQMSSVRRELPAVTDQHGRVAFAAPRQDKFSLVALVAGEPVFVPAFSLVVRRPETVVDVFVDRPLYRPGETAHWKIIARQRKDGRWLVPDRAVAPKLELKLGDETLRAAAEIPLNEFGAAEGSVDIPATARPGTVVMNWEWEGSGDEEREIFTVDNYVPPAAIVRVELASGADSLRPGREMIVRVNASYYSGGPMTDAPVAFDLEGPERNQPFRQQGVTDAKGVAEFHYLVPDTWPNGFTLRCKARVLPKGGQPFDAGENFVISRTGFRFKSDEDSEIRWVAPGGKARLFGRITDGTDQPVPFTGELRLSELRWIEVWQAADGRIVSGLEVAGSRPKLQTEAGWKMLRAEYTRTLVVQQPVQADATGQVSAELAIPTAGLFVAELVKDGQLLGSDYSNYSDSLNLTAGLPGVSLTVVAAAAGAEPQWLSPGTHGLFAGEVPAAGKPWQFAAIVAEETASGWLSLAGENQVVTQLLTTRNRFGSVTVEHPPRFAGLATVQFGRDTYGGDSLTVEVPWTEAQLAVTAQPDANEPHPGASATVNVQVTDLSGAKVRAEVALAVSDEAVNRLSNPSPEKIEPLFLEPRRPQYVALYAFGGASRADDDWPLQDSRVGHLNPAIPPGFLSEDQTLVLSPFMVSTEGDVGYAARSTLAGLRVRTDLKDIGSAITVVTAQFLQDTGSTNGATLLYAPAAKAGGEGNFSGSAPRPITVRRHFASTAFWTPALATGKDGRVTAKFNYPDNLTEWKIEAYVIGADGNSFGRTSVKTRTALPLQARLQLPRVLVEGDTAVVSAALVNRTDASLDVSASLEVKGAAALDPASPVLHPRVTVAKQGEARAAWKLKAARPGAAELALQARAGAEGDGMILPLAVIEDGIQQETAATGRLAPEAAREMLTLQLPERLVQGRAAVTLALTPSYAAAMLDALPYLVDYPYGCVEQTMSRFLPAVVVRKSLVDLELDPAAIEARILGQESKADAARRAKMAGISRLDEVVEQSVARLAAAQRSDGGFGWWPGASETDLWMTAYVVSGLQLASAAGVELPEEMLSQATDATVTALLNSTEAGDREVFALSAVAGGDEVRQHKDFAKLGAVFARLFEARDRLSASGRASLAQASRHFGSPEQRGVLQRNLANGAVRVKATGRGDTVHWGALDNYWRARDGAGESTALTALALLDLDADDALVEPAINWLLLNRRSAHWASTRATTFTILALNRFITARRELQQDSSVDVLVNGRLWQTVKITRDSLLADRLNLTVPVEMLRSGSNEIELRRRSGRGPVYAVALASAWAQGAAVKPASSLMAVTRGFERQAAQPTLAGRLKVVPVALASGGTAFTGEEVAACVQLDVPNALEYVMVEVPKPAGCEPLNPLSGWDARIVRRGAVNPNEFDEGSLIYREERDDKSVFFLSQLDAGQWEIRFSLRAVTPGDFRALPVRTEAMYVPEVRANSDAQRVVVADPVEGNGAR